MFLLTFALLAVVSDVGPQQYWKIYCLRQHILCTIVTSRAVVGLCKSVVTTQRRATTYIKAARRLTTLNTTTSEFVSQAGHANHHMDGSCCDVSRAIMFKNLEYYCASSYSGVNWFYFRVRRRSVCVCMCVRECATANVQQPSRGLVNNHLISHTSTHGGALRDQHTAHICARTEHKCSFVSVCFRAPASKCFFFALVGLPKVDVCSSARNKFIFAYTHNWINMRILRTHTQLCGVVATGVRRTI